MWMTLEYENNIIAEMKETDPEEFAAMEQATEGDRNALATMCHEYLNRVPAGWFQWWE